MNDNELKYFTLSMFAPIRLVWNFAQQELCLRGTMLAGTDQKPFQIQLHGDAAIQSLRAFRSLLDQVDEETVAAAKPRDLQ